ncbi:MAG: hypothetical protein WCG21_11470 [Eubacteriales bacterium]
MKLSKYGLLLTILPLLFFAFSCSSSAATQTDSSSLTAIDQPWLENKPVSVSIMSDTIPTIVVSDSTAVEHILSLVGNLSYYETSSEDLQGGYPTLILEYPGRWILYEVQGNEYVTMIADGSTKEYRIPKKDGQPLYDYLYKYLRDSNAAPT